jgi:hypothetical protein
MVLPASGQEEDGVDSDISDSTYNEILAKPQPKAFRFSYPSEKSML